VIDLKNIKILVNRKKLSCKLLETPAELAEGLMFKRGAVLLKFKEKGTANTTVHTFFCLPMLIAWLDEKGKVLEVIRAKPFWIYMPKKPARYVFETTDKNVKIRVGDKLLCTKS
jgi:uncharacterized membrane protein (UPF0127 family)